MTARQIIQEIEALPINEQEEVVRAVQATLKTKSVTPTIRYASKEEVKRASGEIFDKYADLFHKLAQ
jgi:hypothetical protein